MHCIAPKIMPLHVPRGIGGDSPRYGRFRTVTCGPSFFVRFGIPRCRGRKRHRKWVCRFGGCDRRLGVVCAVTGGSSPKMGGDCSIGVQMEFCSTHDTMSVLLVSPGLQVLSFVNRCLSNLKRPRRDLIELEGCLLATRPVTPAKSAIGVPCRESALGSQPRCS